MSERGVFAVDRGIWEHPIFAKEPFTEREAWAWLISEAAFKPRKKRVGNTVFDLDRGQVAASIRFMAEAWQWHRNRVFRFLTRLKIGTMIDQHAGRDATVITICNYDKYQRVSLPDVTCIETPNGTPTGHQRDKLEDTKHTEEDSEAYASGADAPIDPSIAEREYFSRGRQVLGKNAGGQLAKLLRSNGGNVSLSRSTLELAATKDRPAAFFARAVTPQAQGPPPGKGGFTSVLIDKHRERQNGTSDSEPEFFEH